MNTDPGSCWCCPFSADYGLTPQLERVTSANDSAGAGAVAGCFSFWVKASRLSETWQSWRNYFLRFPFADNRAVLDQTVFFLFVDTVHMHTKGSFLQHGLFESFPVK